VSDVANVAPKLDEIEITPEMIKAVWGTSVSSEDIYDEKERAYVGIFAAMLLSSSDPLIQRISKVVYRGETVASRPQQESR
jgi:hypothetical protein